MTDDQRPTAQDQRPTPRDQRSTPRDSQPARHDPQRTDHDRPPTTRATDGPPPATRNRRRQPAWDAGSVRGLRRHLELTQEQLAGALGVRQQTVSEWETGAYRPRGASDRLLSIVADRAGYDPRQDAGPEGGG